jgi:hypothetical protein
MMAALVAPPSPPIDVWGDYCLAGRLCGNGAGRPTSKRQRGMHIDPKECHPAMDYAEHQKTYKLFLKLTGYIIVGVVALFALLAIFVV